MNLNCRSCRASIPQQQQQKFYAQHCNKTYGKYSTVIVSARWHVIPRNTMHFDKHYSFNEVVTITGKSLTMILIQTECLIGQSSSSTKLLLSAAIRWVLDSFQKHCCSVTIWAFSLAEMYWVEYDNFCFAWTWYSLRSSEA